ncbi:MAG: imidazolonepropionase [Cytophagia bacterium]|nr:imidazolonepropionase [Cytophagia bacterium]
MQPNPSWHWITSVGSLWGHGLPDYPGGQPLTDAWLLVGDGLVKGLGTWTKGSQPVLLSAVPELEAQWHSWYPALLGDQFQRTDLGGRSVMPSFCDPHTHLVWAGDRSSEMISRLGGATYAQIAEAGGGILSTVAKVRALPEEDLLELSESRLHRLMKQGVACFEIKSGYGLSLEAEAKSLRVARQLAHRNGVRVVNTFLGLHALPPEFRHRKKEYVQTVVEDWLPSLYDQGLVDAVDIFCEVGYFGIEDLEALATAANRLGLPVKAHLNQFNAIGGVEAACRLGLASMDHLETMVDGDWDYLGPEAPVVVGLPLCSLYLNLPYAPLGAMLARGQRVALGSDMNPGSAPSGNPWLNWCLGVLRCGLSPFQGLEATTSQAALAMGCEAYSGHLHAGMDAHFLVLPPAWKPDWVVGGMGSVGAEEIWFAARPYFAY